MGIRLSLGSVVACAGAALLAGACGSVAEPGDEVEQLGEVRQQSVVQQPQETDSLAVYAARCDAATGIHVPAFSCNAGLAVPSGNHFAWIDQKSSVDNVTLNGVLTPIGTTTSVSRTPEDSTVTAKRFSVGGGNISGQVDNFQFANVFLQAGRAVTEVKIVGYESPGTGATAGLMLRAGDPNVQEDDPYAGDAPNVFLGITPTGTVYLTYRATKNATTTPVASLTGKSFPIWLRLSYEQDVGTKAEISTNHDINSWQTVGTAPLSPPVVAAGVAVAAATVNYDRFYTTRHCDVPSVLGGSCDLKSSFQVLARTADAIVVANCRNDAFMTPNMYGDIAVIQYNRKNGALCFYQSDIFDSDAEDGSWVSAPSDASGTFEWVSPADTHRGNCTGCHDTGGLIRSPYLKQTGLLPAWGDGYDNNGVNPLRYVGHDFQYDRSFRVSTANYFNPETMEGDTGENCTNCHKMAANTVGEGGTSVLFGVMATSQDQLASVRGIPHKNPPSATSPLWMRPKYDAMTGTYGPRTSYDPMAELTALNFEACGRSLRSANGDKEPGEEWDLSDTHPSDPTGGDFQIDCSFAPHGEPYDSPVQILEDVQWGNGGSSSGTLDNVTIVSGAGTDIYNNADTGVLAQTLIAPGDGSAMVKVTSLKNTNQYAKAGLMFRADSTAGSANVMVAYTAQKGVTFQYRPTANAATPAPVFISNITTLPVWLRLDRSGETFVGYVSTDNRATWQQVGNAVTLPGYGGSMVGLVNTAHTQSTQTGEAKFEAFDFTHAYGWTDTHVLADAKIGGGTGSRHEWITREYVHAGGSNGGGDIQNNADKFWYSFKTFDGNGELYTTVESISSTAQWGKAGLMMRDGVGDTARNVFIGRTTGGVTFQYRHTASQGTTVTNVTTSNQPMDFKLVRSGTTGLTFTGSYRVHGSTTWTQLGSHTFTGFNTKALSGLAVSTQTSGATTDAVFYSGKKVEPPGFLWPTANPDPDPTPPPGSTPCAGICSPASTFNWTTGSYWSGQLGTGAICMETTHAIAGGNCSNLFNGRQLQVNDVTETCNGQNWSSIPAARNGGYCIELGAGERWDAAFSLW